jgi:hypothetical protein
MSGLQPECVLDGAAGAFEGEYAGEATIEDDGAYVAALASSTAQFFTPSGCLVPELEIAALTEVVVRASITATQPNCDAYCAAKARSEAEAECGATATSSTCRAAAGSEYQASCSIACSDGTDYRIVAETELSATAVAELSASQLSGLALGELSVDLTLDRIEDGQGQVVAEAQ